MLAAQPLLDRESYVVLLTELLAEGSTHDGTALGRGGLVVSGAALAAGGGDHCCLLASYPHCVRSEDKLLLNFILAVSMCDYDGN
jgi:hypothetical protein